MTNVAVIGSQWGDEGKGKIVDWLSEKADIIVRFQGGHNAGHTLVVDGTTYKLSLLPSGVVRPGKISVIGNGVVIDPGALLAEIARVGEQGVTITPDNLMIAENAALILPLHQQMDQAAEKTRGTSKIGTTGRGIGPAYEDKIGRRAIRLCDLAHPDTLRARVEGLVAHHNLLRRSSDVEEIAAEDIIESLTALAPQLLPFMQPVWRRLDAWSTEGKRILFEGAQGVMLDTDHGTYPFVTSSNTLTGAACLGAGVSMKHINYVLGITKAYTTRVGSGPFPTEQDNAIGETLGERGHEFGTVTERKRRCGWFDATMVRQAITIGGVDGIALTKLDVLDGFDTLKIGIGYELDGTQYDYLPAAIDAQARITPIYEELPGWQESTAGARRLNDLPEAAITYIRRIEALISAPIALLSTSPKREDTILMHDPFGQ